jgi:hypothetical protein
MPLSGFSPAARFGRILMPTTAAKLQNWANNCAQTAIIPTNSPIEANAAASSTKTRNIICLLLRTYREHSSFFVLTQAAGF